MLAEFIEALLAIPTVRIEECFGRETGEESVVSGKKQASQALWSQPPRLLTRSALYGIPYEEGLPLEAVVVSIPVLGYPSRWMTFSFTVADGRFISQANCHC